MTRTMTRRGWVTAAVLLALAGLGAGVRAQTTTAGGEITKLDKPGQRVTIKHGEIRNLEMPPMTMSFRVRDPKLLDGLSVGDRVRFAAERIDGQYTVTALTRAP